MAIPDYQSIMLPLLELVKDKGTLPFNQILGQLAEHFNLTSAEVGQLYPSGKSTPIFKDRAHWAKTYLKKAGLLESPKRGLINITDRGREVLSENPPRIDHEVLRRYPEFIEFTSTSKDASEGKNNSAVSEDAQTPEEALELNFQKLRSQLADEILEQVKSCTPEFFEKMVVELLVAMGYGGSLKDAGQATQRSNDGGIDGIIKEDRLGLDTIYIQAKRWENSVQRPEIQKFAGALQGVRARKGIFITTSFFSDGAHDFAATIENKIVLIDGEQLAQYMIDFNVGVAGHRSFEIKRIDSDYFLEG